MTAWVSLLIVLLIGIVAGLIFDRLAGPGWLTRQVAGSRRSIVTSSLVGIAGSFIGFHVAGLQVFFREAVEQTGERRHVVAIDGYLHRID